MDEFKAIVHMHIIQHPHVLFIVKTLLSEEISDSEIVLQGYRILYLNRNRQVWPIGIGIKIFW